MRILFPISVFVVVTVFFSGCGKNSSGSGSADSGAKGGERAASTEAVGFVPTEIQTRSGIGMAYLPGGSFLMGSKRGAPDEAPPHTVKVAGFLMDKYEVTHAMYAKVQLPNPSHWQENPQNPVERIRWRDAKQYCNERSLTEGLKPCYNEKTADWDCDLSANGYRLPTEAEWEYACRAGTDGDYEFGAIDKLRQYSWFAENSDQKTHPVGQKKPNRWGLYDLSGNVSEWCDDVYSPTFYTGSPIDNPTGPPNPGADVRRVIRGGSWKSSADQCRSAARQGERTGDSDACFSTDYCGFRCVRRVTSAELAELKNSQK